MWSSDKSEIRSSLPESNVENSVFKSDKFKNMKIVQRSLPYTRTHSLGLGGS